MSFEANEASAVKVAKLLRNRGFRRVRPLAGGIEAWESAGLSFAPVAGRATLAVEGA